MCIRDSLRIGLNKILLTNPDVKVSPRTEQVVQIFVNESGEGLIGQQGILPGVYITNTVVKEVQNKAHIVLINTTNHEIDASNIHCTLQPIDTNIKLINQHKVVEHLKIDLL